MPRASAFHIEMNRLLCLFLRNDFLAVIIAAVFANAVRNLQLMAMGALNERSRRRLVVCKTLIRSALRLLCLGDCHLSHLFVIHFPIARTPRKEGATEVQTSTNHAKTHQESLCRSYIRRTRRHPCPVQTSPLRRRRSPLPPW